jgi:hypothetical protein
MNPAPPAGEFEARVAELAGQVPIALLPVRVEARFVDAELRIRIFPDQIHLDGHEAALTAQERDAGTAYWRERFDAPDPATRTTAPWTTLCVLLGPPRAAWVARALTPLNVAQLGRPDQSGRPVSPQFPATTGKADAWSVAARAVALPGRWVVIGLRGGVEICRAWSNPVSDTLDVTPAPDLDAGPADDDLPALQDSARWLVDFDAAERAGMAVRIGAAEVDGPLDLGFDRLFVLGVDWTLTPQAAAGSLRELLTAHLYTDGLSGIAPGTPTNVTAKSRPGAPPTDQALAAALDPERPPAAELTDPPDPPHTGTGTGTGTGGDRLWRALGLAVAPADPLAAVPGSSGRAQDVAARLADALWESTLGGYLTDALTPVFPDTRTAALREHVRRHLFPGGPFPALRIASQPYGVLPVVARSFTPSPEPLEVGLVAVLAKLRRFWEQAEPSVPRLGRTGDLDADLTTLLHTTPLTAAVRYRTVLGPLTVSSTKGLDRHAVAQQYITSMVGVYLGVPPPTVWNEFTAHPGHQPLSVPLTGPSTSGYLAQLAGLARTSGSYDVLKAHEGDAVTLLEALAGYATARELHRADLRTIDRYRLASGQLTALPAVGVLPPEEYVGIEAAAPAVPGSVLVTTASQASRVVIPTVTGQRTVREFVTAAIGGGGGGGGAAAGTVAPDYQPLHDVLADLDFLGTRPAGELDQALRGLLDAYSHRLDAWYTSLATRRLATLRAAAPGGVHLGGYGWLDDLRPAADAATSHGFIHTPSLGQAATAAVLRSGHLAHNDDEHQALAIDLTADRVRTALTLLDGVAQGQPLAALLGYRFERAVRDRGLELAQYILPIRRLVPLRADGSPAASPTPSDHIAARDVVDGVGLLERWRAEGPALFDALQQLVAWPPPPAEVFMMPPQPERDLLAAELDRLADSYDAVADVLTAEAVHQNVLGNNERAGAALAALDRQGQPPRIDFVRTPRTGKSYAQRLLVLIGDESIPAATWPALVHDARAAAEPRLNAWLARIIGGPRRIRFAASSPGAAWQLAVAFDELGLSPLSAVLACHRPGQDAPSEFEERLLHHFAAKLSPQAPATTKLVLLDDAPRRANTATVGLGAFRALTRWAYTLITTHRPATAGDLALPRDEVGERLDDAQLRGRADALATAYAAALDTLERVIGAAAPTDQELTDALWGAAEFGIDGSVPPPPPFRGSTPAHHDELITRARAVAATMTAALTASDRATAAEAATGGSGSAARGAGDTPRSRVDQQIRRIRALLGEQFPVLPRFTAADPAALSASQAARTALCAGDVLAPGAWLRRMALVRAGVDRLARIRGAAELLRSADVGPRDLVVLQLPHIAGARWLALPFPAGGPGGAAPAPAAAELAVVAHCSGAVDFHAPLAGLFCDAWSETVPGREEITGLALHHDAPNARAPQAVLLAVPPAVTDPAWSVQTILDTVVEAHDLARIRAVGPDTLDWLGTLLPASLLPDSVAPDIPAVDLRALATRAAAPAGGPADPAPTPAVEE